MTIQDWTFITPWNVPEARRKLGISGNIYTVATLPAAATKGDRAFVTDATAPTFLGALVGGGTVLSPVFFDGTNWLTG